MVYICVCGLSPTACCVCVHRLLQSSHAGAEDGPGSVRGAGEDESPRSLEDYDGPERDVDPGGVPMVHLPLHRHLTCRGVCREKTLVSSSPIDLYSQH